MTTEPQSTTTKLEASEPTLEPCPLCRKPLTQLTNGLAYCHNLKTDTLSVDDWIAQSCPLAAHKVQLPTKVWGALNTRVPLNLSSLARKAAEEIREWLRTGDGEVDANAINEVAAIIERCLSEGES